MRACLRRLRLTWTFPSSTVASGTVKLISLGVCTRWIRRRDEFSRRMISGMAARCRRDYRRYVTTAWISGVEPNAVILAAGVLDAQGIGSHSDVAAAFVTRLIRCTGD